MPVQMRSKPRKRRLAKAGSRSVASGAFTEARLWVLRGKKRGGACSGHRLDRIASGDTLLVSAPLYGRCLLVEANPCANCDGPGRTNKCKLRRSEDIVKGFVFPARILPKQGAQSFSGRSPLPDLSYVHGASEVPLLGKQIF